MRDREKDGKIGREQCKSRAMDVMHIDFFFSPHPEDTEAGREGLGGGGKAAVYLR